MAREAKGTNSLTGPPVMPDYSLFSVAMFLVCTGLFMVLDASFARASATGDPYALFRQQCCWAAAGMVGMLAAMYSPYWKLMRWSTPIIGLAIGLLCLVWIPHIGIQSHGAHRWLRLLMVAGPRWQPSEFAKIGVILYLAAYLARRPKAIKCWSPGLMGALFPTLLTVLLIAKEPDMGTSSIVFMTVMVMLFVAGARPRHLAVIVVLVLALAIWHTKSSPYAGARWDAFIHPNRGALTYSYQMHQSMTALQSGGLLGAGAGHGDAKFFHLPAAYTDFIGTTLGEEFGLAGILSLLVMFTWYMVQALRIAHRCANSYGALLASGLSAMLAGQGMLNLAVISGTVPNTGVPLPMISYGGSSLVLMMVSTGLILAVSRWPDLVEVERAARLDTFEPDSKAPATVFGSSIRLETFYEAP